MREAMPGTAFMREMLLGTMIAAIATIIINFPALSAIIMTDEWRYPDIVQESQDESFYLARIREVADGHPFIGHPYVYERREQIYPLGQLSEWVLGTTMRLFDLQLKTIAFAADLFFPFLLPLLVWIATRSILPQRRWRLLLVAALFLGAAIPGWKRPISPQAITLLPLLYLWGVLTPRQSQMHVAMTRSGLIGLMLYSYPYHWTYCLVLEVLLTSYDLWRIKSWHDRWKRVAAFLLPAGVLALPWIWMNMLMIGNDAYHQMLLRLGLQQSHLPTGPIWQVRIAVILLLILFSIRLSKRMDLLLPLSLPLIAGLFVFNQTLITGKELEFSSHYSKFLHFPLWTGLLTSLLLALRRFPTADRIAAYGGLTIMLLSTVLVTQKEYMRFHALIPDSQERIQQSTIMYTLQALPQEHVLLTDQKMAQDITLYTHHYPFFAPQTHMYLLPDAEVQQRAAAQHILIPSDPLQPRTVYGSSYLNRALNERARCKVYGWIGKADPARCARTATEYLPDSWPAIRDGTAMTEADAMQVLMRSHVSLALLREVPPSLRPHLTPMRTFGEYRLYDVRL